MSASARATLVHRIRLGSLLWARIRLQREMVLGLWEFELPHCIAESKRSA
jgi:hypothetical protein